jgi:hypothetical protein
MHHYDTNAFKHATTKKSYDSTRTVIADAPQEIKTKSKKDTKKWCKGVVGREHKSVWVYAELLWAHRRSEEFQEPPIPPVDRPRKDARGLRIYWHHPCATLYCTVCHKHIKYAEDAFKLRRAGVKILTKLPEAA